MKLVDPTVKLVAAGTSDWTADVVETPRLLLQQAGHLIDYLDVHWYIGLGMETVDFPALMATSELLEERLRAMEGIIRIMRLNHGLEREIHLAVCEYNVLKHIDHDQGIEAIFNLQDMLVIAQNLNAFLRHARSVKMANISEIVNMGGPIRTDPDGDGLVLQTTWHALELYGRLSGDVALDAWLESDATFSGNGYSSVPVLDIAATRDRAGQQLTLFLVNRSADAHSEGDGPPGGRPPRRTGAPQRAQRPRARRLQHFRHARRDIPAYGVPADTGQLTDRHARTPFPHRAGVERPPLRRCHAVSALTPRPPLPEGEGGERRCRVSLHPVLFPAVRQLRDPDRSRVKAPLPRGEGFGVRATSPSPRWNLQCGASWRHGLPALTPRPPLPEGEGEKDVAVYRCIQFCFPQ